LVELRRAAAADRPESEIAVGFAEYANMHHSATAQALADAETKLALLRDAGAPSKPGSLDEAENQLRRASYDGAIPATGDLTVPAGPMQVIQIPSTAWGPSAQIVRITNVLKAPWGDVYLNVRYREADLDRIRPARKKLDSEAAGSAQPEPEDLTDDLGRRAAAQSGTRTNRAAAAENACKEWIACLSQRPDKKDAAFEKPEPRSPPSARSAEKPSSVHGRIQHPPTGRRQAGERKRAHRNRRPKSKPVRDFT
jgi:hypothetical protein